MGGRTAKALLERYGVCLSGLLRSIEALSRLPGGALTGWHAICSTKQRRYEHAHDSDSGEHGGVCGTSPAHGRSRMRRRVFRSFWFGRSACNIRAFVSFGRSCTRAGVQPR